MENVTNNKENMEKVALDAYVILEMALFQDAEQKVRDELCNKIMDRELNNWDDALVVFNDIYRNATDDDKKKILDAIMLYSAYRAEVIEHAGLKKDFERFGISMHKENAPEVKLSEHNIPQDDERREQAKKLHKCNVMWEKRRDGYHNKALGSLYLGSEPIDKNYSDRGVKRWHEYPRTVKIGSKYLDIERALLDLTWNINSLGLKSKSEECMLQYVSDPRERMEDWIQSVVAQRDEPNNITKAVHSYGASSNLIYGRNLILSLGYSEELVYDFWKKLTGKGDSIYFNEGCCGRWKYDDGFTSDVSEKEKNIQRIVWRILDRYETHLAVRISDNKGTVHDISIKEAMRRMLKTSGILEPFAEEKKRYAINKAYLKYLMSLVSKDLFDYLETLDLEELKKISDSHNETFEGVPERLIPINKIGKPFIVTEVFNGRTLTAEMYDVTDAFMRRVIAPYFSTDRFFWDFKKNPGRYHLSGWDEADFHRHSYWDNEKHAEQLRKMIDEEDPLTKYEFSPVFKKRILDSGYDGVGSEKYATVMLEGFNLNISIEKLLKMKTSEFTDDEKYMLGKYADQTYALNVVSNIPN